MIRAPLVPSFAVDSGAQGLVRRLGFALITQQSGHSNCVWLRWISTCVYIYIYIEVCVCMI